jgi:murein DD-endopeptidase MepM/ murein hydrolase activator NlpD
MFISKPIPKLTSQFISTFARIVCILITCNVIAFLAQGSYSGISETSIPSDPTPQNPAIVSATGLASCRSITEAVNQSTVSTRIASHQPITADISASAETGRNPNRSPAASSATTSSVQMSDIRNSNTSNSGAARQCRARMVLPVADAHISKSFDRPSMRWATGHRGVDITAGTGTALIAPDDGVISFNGTVAGKDVISIKHADGLTSTFEPAHSDLETGAPVFRGKPFGVADGLSDHCLDLCVHWGVMDASDDYLDPSTLILPRTIALKPVQVGD